MIILRQLQVLNFKSLRDVDLAFPTRASILVEGLNEAGKSSLFEAIYFALYGEPLITEDLIARGRPSNDSAINYRADSATVTLTLDMDGSLIQVTRTLRRGRGTTAHLEIITPQGSAEEVAGQRAVNTRVVQELGNLNKEALLNSCFVEQKKLAKLEELDGPDRQKALEYLLNLEKLQALHREFRVTREDETAITRAQDRFNLARAQARVPVLERELHGVRERLAAVEMHEALGSIAEQEGIRAEAQQRLDGIQAERKKLEAVRSRITAVKKAIEALRRYSALSENLDRWEAEVARLTGELEGLDRREREDLPRLQVRLADLEELGSHLEKLAQFDSDLSVAQGNVRACELELQEIKRRTADAEQLASDIEREGAKLGELAAQVVSDESAAEGALQELSVRQVELKALRRLFDRQKQFEREHETALQEIEREGERTAEYARLKADLENAQSKEDAAQGEQHSAEEAYQTGRLTYASANEARLLEAWLQAQSAQDAITSRDAKVIEAEQAVEEAQSEFDRHRRDAATARRSVRMPAAGGAAAIIAGGVLLPLGPALPGIVLLLVGIGLVALSLKAMRVASVHRRALDASSRALDQARQQQMKVAAERAAMEALGGAPGRISSVMDEMQSLGIALPVDSSQVNERLAHLRASGGDGIGYDLPALRVAVDNTRAVLDEARRKLAEAKTRREMLQGQVAKHPAANVAAGTITSAERHRDSLAEELSDLREQLEVDTTKCGVQPNPTAIEQEISSIEEKAGRHNRILAAIPSRKETLSTRESHLEGRRKTLAQEQSWLAEHPYEGAEATLSGFASQVEELQRECMERKEEVTRQAGALNVASRAGAVQQARGAVEAAIQQLRVELDRRAQLESQRRGWQTKVEQGHENARKAWEAMVPLPDGIDVTLAGETASLDEVETVAEALEEKLAVLDEQRVSAQLSELDRQEGDVSAQGKHAEQEITRLRSLITRVLAAQNLGAVPSVPTEDSVLAIFPVFGEVGPGDRERLEVQEDELQADLKSTCSRRDELAEMLSLVGVTLDECECEAELAARRRDLKVKTYAERIVREVRQRMVDKVLPNTEINMRMLLPLLTLDRYRDCQITPDYKLQIWDELAGRYVSKSIFSGGTRDQFSLALRLAFALATLPQELGTTPGFIFLDEPLSSFDGPRTEALVNLLTRGQIASNFSQIFVISHNRMFDQGAFTHHLVLDNGAVVEHDFDKEQAARQAK